MDYTLTHSSRRTLAIAIDKEGSLIVRAPLRYSVDKIESFLREKTSWIEKHKNKIQIQKNIQASEQGYYRLFGEKYPLEGKNEEDLKKLYKKSLQEYLDMHLSKLAFGKRFQRSIGKIRISSARTRWGSCSNRGNLSFSYRLARYPTLAIDAVIIHELAHLTHANHSKKFWQLVTEWMPEYKENIAFLKGVRSSQKEL